MAERIPGCKCPIVFQSWEKALFTAKETSSSPLGNLLWLHSVRCGCSCIGPFGKGDAPQASQGEDEVFSATTWAAMARPPEAAASTPPCPARRHGPCHILQISLLAKTSHFPQSFIDVTSRYKKVATFILRGQNSKFESTSRPVFLNLSVMTPTCLSYQIFTFTVHNSKFTVMK